MRRLRKRASFFEGGWFMGSVKWSNDEMRVLRAHYGEHGPDWVGWEMLLPGRTKSAIQSQARKTGLLMARPAPKKKCVRKQPKPLKRSVDPYAKIILRMLGDGMTVSEVDAHMKWVPGKAKFILTEHWNSQGDAL